jgi:branched-chain amino acid transport system ATP-binding protein
VSLLKVEHLALHFGGLKAVDDLTFAVETGEIFAIIGPNGAGKTSVFNVMTRIFAATAGHITFDGRDITRLPRQAIAGARIARTFQNIELFEKATVLDNLLLGRYRFAHGGVFGGFLSQMLRLPHIAAAERADRDAVETIIDILELSPYRSVPVSELPYGVRKIVEIGRALATDPRMILLDEPASGLNPEETRDLSFWIEDIRADLGVTIIMVEHDMSLVADVADRVLCMNLGRALATGTAAEVQSHPDVVAAYLGV